GTYLARARVTIGADTATEVVREVEVRPGRRPPQTQTVAEAPFDPREVVNGAFGRQFAASLAASGTAESRLLLSALGRLAERDYPAAIASLQQDTASGPAAFFLGWAYYGAGETRQAISAWRRAAFLDPTIVPAHLALADAYVRLAQPALAVQAVLAGLA